MQDTSSLFPPLEPNAGVHEMTERLCDMMGNLARLPKPVARPLIEVFASDLVSAFHQSGNEAYGRGFDAGVRAARPTLLESPGAFPERVIAVASSPWEFRCRATMASLLDLVQARLQETGAAEQNPVQAAGPLLRQDGVSVVRAGLTRLRDDAPAAPDIWGRLALGALGASACAIDHPHRDLLATAQTLLCVALSAHAPGDPDL